eukprot:CAMPEP_0182478114 /NCGR_PEP_ID=MMETSP1319-20130603/31990_1 /TAXON_ID=172717 /ORGANISM="Bolidomonas pacifica, Strain RCC208" /LENGTH=45 /DNA_ID= /DNA_START= /DNA_END= /DNA_ORIENTATION=
MLLLRKLPDRHGVDPPHVLKHPPHAHPLLFLREAQLHVDDGLGAD